MSNRYRVELHHPEHTFNPRTVKDLSAWSTRMAKQLPRGTLMTIYRTSGHGTIQYRLEWNGWRFLRETYS